MIFSRLAVGLGLCLCIASAVPSAEAAPPVSELVEARLVAEDTAATPGRPLWVGLHMRMKESWHTYWRNPGDTGLPTEIKWQLPEGVIAGPIVWPTPHRIPVGSLVNFGYDDEVLLLTEIKVPAGFAAPSLNIVADVSWLVCQKECVPGEARLTLSLPTAGPSATATPDPVNEGLFYKARQAVPVPAPWPASITESAPGSLILQVAAKNLDGGTLKGAFFFPGTQMLIDHAAAQPFKISADGLTIELTRNTFEPNTKASADGVLLLTETVDGREVSQAVGLTPSEAVAPAGPTHASAATTGTSLLQAMLFALLGGLILNLMPCVFPVLSVKVLSLVQHSGEPPHRIRLHGLIYSAGVVAAFLVLAGLLLAARAAGQQVGWGFQLQSPVVVLVLAYVVFAMGLSLSGLVDLGLSMTSWGGSLAERSGLSGSFFAGALAAVVATPCTAPFMGTALGFALTQPAAVALGVFLALGLGLALPFLALTFAPQLLSRLPRPGPWMQTLKQALAFPLYVTAAWLLWVLSQQVGSAALFAALLGFVAVALALWALRLSQGASGWPRRAAQATTFAAIVATLGAVGSIGQGGAQPASLTLAKGSQASDWEPFSQARLDALRAEGRPVFVNMTAAWCITCLVNERTALSSEAVKAELANRGVVYLKGDWTNRDPEISRVLEQHGRAGVPLYLLFAGKRDPIVLPQILTPSIVLDGLSQLGTPAAQTRADVQSNRSKKE